MMLTDIKKLKIVHYPGAVLRCKAKHINKIDNDIVVVAGRMVELMHEAKGCGLAAPQVGLSWRLFVFNSTGGQKDDQVVINPVLSNPSKELMDREEGCLSIPEVTAQIRRPKGITLSGLDLAGQAITMTSDDLPARIWQHEYDHLEGVLILDRMTPMDRLANEIAIHRLEESLPKKKRR